MCVTRLIHVCNMNHESFAVLQKIGLHEAALMDRLYVAADKGLSLSLVCFLALSLLLSISLSPSRSCLLACLHALSLSLSLSLSRSFTRSWHI